MAKTIQVKEQDHKTIKLMAAEAGVSIMSMISSLLGSYKSSPSKGKQC